MAKKPKGLEGAEKNLAKLESRYQKEVQILDTIEQQGPAYDKQLALVRQIDSAIEGQSAKVEKLADTWDQAQSHINKANDRIDSMSEKLQKYAKNIPIIGTALSDGISKAAEGMKKTISDFTSKSGSILKRGFSAAFGIIKALLTGILVAGIALFMSLYNKAKNATKEFSTSMTETARTLNMSKKTVQEIGKGVGDWVHYGSAWATTINQIKDDMGYLPALTAQENKLVAKLAANAGLSSEHISTMYELSVKNGMELDKWTSMQEKKINMLNAELGVNFSQRDVIVEISSASDETLAMFGKQNAELEKQVLIGKKIGLNLNQQAQIAKSLLDIESSIEKEMEARVLTGKELNFDKARELALNGDISGASAEILEQVGGIDEFNKMNIIQKQAIADAAGLEVGALQTSLETKKQMEEGGQSGVKDQGLDAAAQTKSKDEVDNARERRWGTLLQPVFLAVDKISKAFGDFLFDWFKDPSGGGGVLEWINTKATDLAEYITSETGLKADLLSIKDKVTEWWSNFKESKMFKLFTSGKTWKLLAGGIFLAWLTKKAWNFLLGTAARPMSVRISGGLKGMINSFKKGWKGLKGTFGKVKGWLSKGFSKVGSLFKGGGKGGGLFGKIGKGLKWLGGKAKQGAKWVGSKAKSVAKALNPMNVLKKAAKSKAGKFIAKAGKSVVKTGGKAFKGGLIGALFGAAELASILASDASPLDKAKGVIRAGAGILGGALGSIAGSVVPVVGTFGGGLLGGFLGDWIGSIPAIQDALAPPLANLFKGSDQVDDFILSPRGMTKFRKDDLVIGGTKLNQALGIGGDSGQEQLGEIAALLHRLIEVVEDGKIIQMNGNAVGEAIGLDRIGTGVA